LVEPHDTERFELAVQAIAAFPEGGVHVDTPLITASLRLKPVSAWHRQIFGRG
jgi:hypothetical protein